MSFIKDFKEFAIKGNAFDLAVGVIIGAAFGKIVDSIVNDLVMPVIGMLFGKMDFSNMFIVLGDVPAGTGMTLAELKKAGVPLLAYGNFLTIIINFILLALVVFSLVRYFNSLKKQSAAEAAAAPVVIAEDVLLLREIRDQLKK